MRYPHRVDVALLLAATAAVMAAGSALFRKRCPMCAKRSVVEASNARLDRAARMLHWRFRCRKCSATFASSDGRTLIPTAAWDAGVRGSFDANARVIKDR
jgi:transposase-like protein